MEDILVPIVVVGILFLGLPWVIFHYITKWKTSATLTNEDEAMLDQMHETARRLDERLATIERIIAADNPDFRPARSATADDDYSFDRRN
ncbi:envelope stress response membrane protein PspB [Sphingobium algorifonticola]|uniref:Envelope stress response membrane protein PspB n=1 Tax=Sphingobium algorifonticola TaxID=2008318 RepID=A0A437JB44_9SPHN|nr:envelope stress response membrane protein PspB [Sphingobium algorifonticola]RVT43091.1 envelope stress response membrane protein PspB [Sphingobium algorifonticola]